MITKCDHRLMLLNTQRLKSAIKIISLLLFSFVSFVTPSYGWSLYVGQYTKNKRANEWGAVQDFTKSYAPKNMLNPIAIHNGSGLREISVSNNATELDPGTGLSCNKDHDNHVLTMYHATRAPVKPTTVICYGKPIYLVCTWVSKSPISTLAANTGVKNSG